MRSLSSPLTSQDGRGPLRRYWPLIAALALILFPFGWLAEQWPAFGELVGALFDTALAHAIGHALSFLGLGLAALLLLPGLRARPLLFIALAVLVGVGQEVFQLAYKARPPVFDDARDVVVDIVGALAALAIARLLPPRRR